jgi:hypothetical protein
MRILLEHIKLPRVSTMGVVCCCVAFFLSSSTRSGLAVEEKASDLETCLHPRKIARNKRLTGRTAAARTAHRPAHAGEILRARAQDWTVGRPDTPVRPSSKT